MKINKIFKKFNYIKLLWILFSAMLIIIFFNSLGRSYILDEFEGIHTAWKILHGERMYFDFFQHHHPFSYYLYVPLILIFKETTTVFIAARLMIFFMLLLIFLATYLISTKVFGKETGIISLILLLSTMIFVDRAIEIRPDVSQVLFGLFSVSFLLNYFEDKSLKSLLLSSISLGLSFLFLQKTIFLVLVIIFLLLTKIYRKEIVFRSLLFYILGFGITVAPYYIYITLTNSLSNYIMFNWTLNANIKILDHFSPFRWLIKTFHTNSIFWLFFGLGSLFFLKTPGQRRIGILALGLLLSTFFVPTPYSQYFMLAMSFAAIISAHAFNSLFNGNKRILIVALIISVLYPAYYFLGPYLFSYELSPSQFVPREPWPYQLNHSQLEKVDYVLSVTDTKDFVYDGNHWDLGTNFNVFRKDLDFFWFALGPINSLPVYKILTNYHYDIYELIEKHKPKIISKYYIPNMNDRRIRDFYVQSKRYEDLYIRADAK